MSNQITFCINTARNERFHLELLFRSLHRNLSRHDHEIIVYVENDNQGTVEFLKTQKSIFSDLKIVVNPLPIPIGYARNINLMFEMAKYPIVSYLQSDMVISTDYDLEVLKHLNESNIISSTRIEPPLHPPSPEKITHDFGLDPQKFDLEAFTQFANTQKSDRITNYWFAPFTLYKKHWLEIGGHDTLFRRSREDSDLLYRFTMKGLKIEQAWNAIVYHFTCTSSRGIEWWTEKAKARTALQQQADMMEMKRFLYKWPRFKHNTTFDPNSEYKYRVSCNVFNIPKDDYRAMVTSTVPLRDEEKFIDKLLQFWYCLHHIYLDSSDLRHILRETDKPEPESKGYLIYNPYVYDLPFLHKYANQLLSSDTHPITDEIWDKYRKYYRTINPDDFLVNNIVVDDIVLNIDVSKAGDHHLHLIQNINIAVHENFKDSEPGTYELPGYEGMTITINRIVNRISENLIVKNPPIDDIPFTII